MLVPFVDTKPWYVYKMELAGIRSIGRSSSYQIGVVMRVLVLVILLAVSLLLAMDAVALEGRRMLGDRGGGSTPGSPVANLSPNVGH